MAWTNPTQPNVTDYTTFLYDTVGVAPGVLPATAYIIPLTLSVAVMTVNRALMVGASPSDSGLGLVPMSLYVLACYNLATDRLFNWANDVPGQTFFVDSRVKMRLLEPAVGVATSASDQGTAGSLMNPEQLKMLTLDDLHTLKTPWGRTYLGLAQSFGPNLFGLG